MTRCAKMFATLLVVWIAVAPTAAIAQTDEAVTHGGYGAITGAFAAAALGGATALVAAGMYMPPRDVDCDVEPRRCRPNAFDHTVVALTAAAAVTGVYFSGYGAQRFAESKSWDPVLGWSLTGGYLGFASTLLLQSIIPDFSPEWLRQVLGLTLGAGGAVAGGYAFRAISLHEGHAWPEFGFGVGGMVVGTVVGALIADQTAWAPFLGGLGAVVAASAATLAF